MEWFVLGLRLLDLLGRGFGVDPAEHGAAFVRRFFEGVGPPLDVDGFLQVHRAEEFGTALAPEARLAELLGLKIGQRLIGVELQVAGVIFDEAVFVDVGQVVVEIVLLDAAEEIAADLRRLGRFSQRDALALACFL